MQTQKLNPVTSGTRHQIKILKNILNKNSRVVKNLSNFFQQKQGRGINLGCITVRHKGGGHKKVYRLVNFGNFRGKLLVLSNYYDPFRNAFVSLVFDFVQKDFDFVLMTSQTTAGSVLVYEFKECLIDLKLGYRTLIKNVPAGSLICNLSTNSNSKAAFIRSAGTFGQIIQKTNQFFKIRLPSGKILTVDNLATATIGTVSNAKHRQTVIGKAGRNRLLGKRPGTRGIAMNPVDHPHGGRTNGGQKTCMTPWGKPTRGSPTRKKVFKM